MGVHMSDIGNTVYFYARKTLELVFGIATAHFGEEEGCIAIIANALYRLKMSGSAWHAILVEDTTISI
jgi:hypothetical protein